MKTFFEVSITLFLISLCIVVVFFSNITGIWLASMGILIVMLGIDYYKSKIVTGQELLYSVWIILLGFLGLVLVWIAIVVVMLEDRFGSFQEWWQGWMNKKIK